MITLPTTEVTKLTEQGGCIVIGFREIKRFNLVNIENIKLEMIPLFLNKDCKFIFDLSEIEFVDSTGIGCLILLSKSGQRNNSQMKICNVAPSIMKVFHLLRLPMFLDVEEDIESCIKNFKECVPSDAV